MGMVAALEGNAYLNCAMSHEIGSLLILRPPGSDFCVVPAKSRFYEQVTRVKWFLSFPS